MGFSYLLPGIVHLVYFELRRRGCSLPSTKFFESLLGFLIRLLLFCACPTLTILLTSFSTVPALGGQLALIYFFPPSCSLWWWYSDVGLLPLFPLKDATKAAAIAALASTRFFMRSSIVRRWKVTLSSVLSAASIMLQLDRKWS